MLNCCLKSRFYILHFDFFKAGQYLIFFRTVLTSAGMTRPPRFLPSTTSLRRDLFSLVRSYGSRLQKPRRPTPPPHPCSPKMRGSNPVWPERNLKKLSSQLILKNQKWWTHSLSESTSGTSLTEKVLRVPLPSASIVPILSALTDFICLQVQTQRQTQTKVFNKLITSFIH